MLAIIVLFAVLGIAYTAVPLVRSGINFVVWKATTNIAYASGFAENGNTRIFYESYGDGTPLVLLHGGLSSNLDWIGEIPTLSQNFRLVLINLRGHGRSTLGDEPFTYRLLASDVLAVFDELHIERANIVGWSDGGNTGLLFAINYPTRIRRLVAISANYHPEGIVEGVFEMITNAPEKIDPLPNRWMHRLLSGRPEQWAELRQRVIEMWHGYPLLSPAELADVHAPTLVMIGADDDVELQHSRSMAAAIAGAELLVIPDVGHAVPRDAPEAVVTNVERFLRGDDDR